MATKNDVTGDSIQSRAASEAYAANYDAIFGKKKAVVVEQVEEFVPAEQEE
jgi:hypothetical protein